jgi:dihydrofolate reductase
VLLKTKPMSKFYFANAISLDGFLAGENGGPKNPIGDGGLKLHEWMFRQDAFLEQVEMKGTGEKGLDNDLVIEIMSRAGAWIMGRRIFDEGEFNWPENAPFHCPVFVLTKEKRAPWERKGGTTFYFINNGLEEAVQKAKAASGGKDIRIAGGANLIQQCLNAGIVADFVIHQVPIFLGKGVRLFDNIHPEKVKIELKKVMPSKGVTHLFYNVIQNG